MDANIPGVDIKTGLRYAGADGALYIACLRQFPLDPSLSGLKQALNCGDMDAAFVCAHTFKGLCAQLGIVSLARPADGLCELLRTKDPAALPAARVRLACLCRRHAQVVRAIRRL